MLVNLVHREDSANHCLQLSPLLLRDLISKRLRDPEHPHASSDGHRLAVPIHHRWGGSRPSLAAAGRLLGLALRSQWCSPLQPVQHWIERQGETLTIAREAGTPPRLVRSNPLLGG